MIEARPNAPLGSVSRLGAEWSLDAIGLTDAILCRNNAPLVGIAFRLIRKGIPCNYLGKNLQEQLEGLLRKFKVESTAELFTRLERYRSNEVSRLRLKRKMQTAANFSDMCECLKIIASNSKTVADIPTFIKKIFGDRGVTLSTIHKAKGLEWETVWILNRFLIPSPYAASEAALRQEAHLLHVAITRAKLNLKYINT